MWILGGFWKILKGFWRLLVGLVIGAVIYVWMFFNFKGFWENTHHQVTYFMDWVVKQPMAAEYSQWNTLLNMDDKLTFALYIMAGRVIWLMFEAILFTFPHWLFIGRNKQKKTANSPELAPIAPERRARASDASSVKAPVMGHSGVDKASVQQVAAPAAAIAASAMGQKEQTGTDQSNGHAQPDETSENLERSIDEALQRIKKVGEQNSNK